LANQILANAHEIVTGAARILKKCGSDKKSGLLKVLLLETIKASNNRLSNPLKQTANINLN